MRLPLLLALAIAAGCVVPGPGPSPTAGSPWSERALTFGGDHDHTVPGHHANMTTPNFEIVGWDPLLSPDYGGSTPGGYLCGDAQPTIDGRRIAVVESRSDVGITIVDVTDPAAPEWLGELVMRRTYVYDVAVVPDGKHVIAVTSGLSEPQQRGGATAALPALAWRTPCGTIDIEDPVPRPPSTLLISIEDPSRPRIIDMQPVEGFGHSVTSTLVENRRWVAVASVLTGATDSFDFYEIVDTPAGARLSRLATYATALDDRLGTDVGGHSEVLVTTHPGLQKTVAYVQSRDTVRVMDMTDPRRPALLGSWSDVRPGREGFSGLLHSVFPFPEMRDGRHLVAIGPEWEGHPDGMPSGIVWIVDDTDPADMRAVAAWALPHEVEWDGRLMYSTHYLCVVGETMFVSMYHGGVWAIDISGLTAEGEGRGGEGRRDDLLLLPSVGVFMPVNVSPRPPEIPVRWTPTLEEVLPMPDGTLVTFDSNSGVYTFRFDETRPMAPPAPWPIPPLD